ncbi:alpha/beta fold hydrolase [Ancylobacter sp. IITR112]|uniref:alpha/beta fold hydrolase n=1 Tax=Ancylobacter sp. IITR112 TaxID=3138073 RepID=UPI00352BB517
MPSVAVFLPTFFAGSWVWSAQIEIMRNNGYEPILFDEPFLKLGDNNNTLPKLVTFVKNALLQYRSQDMVVFGNSMGGYIGLALASDPTFNIRQAFVGGCPGAGENVALGLGVSRILSLNYAHKISRELFHNPCRVDPHMVETTFRAIANRQCFMTGISILRSLQKIDVRDFIGDLAVDTHLIWGLHDRVTPIDPWRELAAINPYLHLHAIADAGHCPMIETPAAFNAVLERTLLQQHPARPGMISEAQPAP